jgi:hypothetical protein
MVGERMERIKLIKMVVSKELHPEKDRFVYIQKTSISLKGFLNKFEGVPNLETLIVTDTDLHGAFSFAYESIDSLPDEHFAERFNSEFEETKAKFLELHRTQKGVILFYRWGIDSDFIDDVIVILQPEDVHLGLISPEPILRQASMEIMKNLSVR